MSVVDWSAYSEPKLRCLLMLDRVVPLHETSVRVAGCRTNTREALINEGLVDRIYLYEEGRSTGLPFMLLTRAGAAVKRDYVLWHRKVKSKLGNLPSIMDKVAETRL